MALFFRAANGQTLIQPGAVSVVDARGGLQAGLSLGGIVAIVGTAAAGEPWARPDGERGPVYQIDDPADGVSVFQEGSLADAVHLLSHASADRRIQGGPARVLAIKLNRSTRSVCDLLLDRQGTLPTLEPDTAVVLTATGIRTPGGPPPATTSGFLRLWSRDFGPHTETITAELFTALEGVRVSAFWLELTHKDKVERSPVFHLPRYRQLATGTWEWDPGDSILSVHYKPGLVPVADLVVEVLTTRQADGSFRATELRFTSITLFPLFPSNRLRVLATAPPGAGANHILVAPTFRQLFAQVGPLLAGNPAAGGGYEFVPTDPALNLDRTWADLDALGAVTPADTDPDVSGTFNRTPAVGQPAIVDVALTNLAARLVRWIDEESRLVRAEPRTSRVLLPRATSHSMYARRVFAGEDGLHHANDASWRWSDLEQALDALLEVRVNTIVPLFSDPGEIPPAAIVGTAEDTLFALHLALREHAREAETTYKSERNVFLAYDATFDALRRRLAEINDPSVSLCGQAIRVLDAQSQLRRLPAWALACAAAGMQAGARVGEPLTFKRPNIQGAFQKGNTWSPKNVSQANALVQAGLLFVKPVEGGYRWVRDRTTYVTDANLVYTDRHVKQAVDTVSYEVRTEIENRFTGESGLPVTVGAVREVAVEKLEALRTAGIIVDSFDETEGKILHAWRDLSVRLVADVLFFAVVISPVTGINYVEIRQTIQLPNIRA